jgi:flavin prenyltransferase
MQIPRLRLAALGSARDDLRSLFAASRRLLPASCQVCSTLDIRMPQLYQPENVTVAITGASGSVFAVHLLQALEADKRVKAVNLIVSDTALRVLAEEVGIRGRNDMVSQLLGAKSKKIQQQNNDDIAANVASGSYPTDAMIVIPCSMGTLSRIANGMSTSLIERAADVCLKEQRPLILCARETPLNKIHIRNMYRAADAGAVIYPLIPTFYNKPIDSNEMARQFAARVLQHVGLPQSGAYRWKA